MSCVHGIVVGFSVCVNDYDLKFRILDLREKPTMAQGSRFSRPIPPSQFFVFACCDSSENVPGLAPRVGFFDLGFCEGYSCRIVFLHVRNVAVPQGRGH